MVRLRQVVECGDEGGPAGRWQLRQTVDERFGDSAQDRLVDGILREIVLITRGTKFFESTVMPKPGTASGPVSSSIFATV